MSSNKTEHLTLHAWKPDDMFTREEFNENFAAIDGEAGEVRTRLATAQAVADAALAAAKAAQGTADAARSAADAAQSTANGRLRIQTGVYQGDGTKLTSANKKTLNFDFRPEVVIILPKQEGTETQSYQVDTASGTTLPSILLLTRAMKSVSTYHATYSFYLHLTWGDTTLSWYPSDNKATVSVSAAYSLNTANSWYHWVAIG